jgi:hypothetical protein
MSYVPRRGDFGAEHASDLIPIVEATNCVLGCINAGTATDIGEFGPGGNCPVLAMVCLGDGAPVPELTRVGRRIDCSARVDPATAGMGPFL